MKKRVVSLMLTAVMLASSVVSASAADFNVNDELGLLEQATGESSSDMTVDEEDSSDDSSEAIVDENNGNSENASEIQETVDPSQEAAKTVNLSLVPNNSWVFLKGDLDKLKEDYENKKLSDGSDDFSTGDVATMGEEEEKAKSEKYNLDTTSVEEIKKALPNDYSECVDLDNLITLLDGTTLTYSEGSTVGAFVVPYEGYKVESVALDSNPLTAGNEYSGSLYYSATLGNTDATFTVNTVEDVVEPTETPVVEPTETTTVEPTETPTVEPTEEPTVEPTETPSEEPTVEPTVEPTETPEVTPVEDDSNKKDEDVENIYQDPDVDDMDFDKEEKVNDVDCTCDSLEYDVLLHSWDCARFQQEIKNRCTCGKEDEGDITKHSYDCDAVQAVYQELCTCDVQDQPLVHDNCKVIEMLHSYLCDCGEDYDSVDKIVDSHSEDSAIVKYLMDWSDWVNSHIDDMALASASSENSIGTFKHGVPGAKKWGTDGIPFSYGIGSFWSRSSGRVTDVSGYTKKGRSSNSTGTNHFTDYLVPKGNTGRVVIPNSAWVLVDGKYTVLDTIYRANCTSSGGFVLSVSDLVDGQQTLAFRDAGYFGDNSIRGSEGVHKISIYVYFVKHNTTTQVAINGASQICDIDNFEGVNLTDSSITGIYTLPGNASELGTDSASSLKNFIVGSVNSSGEKEKCVQFTFKTAVGDPLHFVYYCGTDKHMRGMWLNREDLTVSYELVGTVPTGVKAPIDKHISYGTITNTTTALNTINTSMKAAGYTFSGWYLDKNFTSGNTYKGKAIEKSNIHLYGKFTKNVGKVSVKKVVNASFKASMPENKKTFRFYLEGKSDSGETISKNLTCKDGEIKDFTNVPTGTYSVRETGAGKESEGYIAAVRFSCKAKIGTGADQSLTYDSVKGYAIGNVKVTKGGKTLVTFTNTPKTGKLTVSKSVSGIDLSKLKDANKTFKFTVSGTSYFGTTVNQTKTVVGNGSVTFTGIPIGAKYSIKEASSGSWSFVSGVAPDGTKVTNASSMSYSQTSAESKASFTNKYIYKGSYAVKKVDADDTSKILKGAEFDIYQYNAKTSSYDTKIGSLYWDGTDKYYHTGELVGDDINEGKFRIVETKNPEGYSGKWSTTFKLQTGANNKVIVAKNTNTEQNYGTIRIEKCDSVTGDIISDHSAEFTVYEYNKINNQYEDTVEATARSIDPVQFGNNKVVWEYEEDSYTSKNLYITDKNQGKFKVVETKNPLGYTGSWDKYFTLKPNVVPEDLEFTVTNNPTKLPVGKIVVNKRIKASDVLWAFGNPTFRFTVSGTDTFGSKHTYQGFVEFHEDTEVDQSGYMNLSYVVKGVPTGTYEITEAKTLSYKFGSCNRVTSNVTEKGTYLVATLSYNKSSGKVATAEGTFTNNHSEYDQYRHTDVVENKADFVASK